MDNSTDQIIIEQLQTLRVCNMPKGMPDHITIQKLIQEKRTLTNARNRLNYKLRSANGTNLQLKSSSQLQPKGRPVQKITVADIQLHISRQNKKNKTIPVDEPLR